MDHLDDLLFIDEYSHKGFCSEECIEDFYFPLIKHYEMIEHSLRRKHNIESELPPGTIIEADVVEAVLENPSEIFRQTNELHETFYNFIKHYTDFSVIVVASVYRKEASFVFLATRTKSQALITEFRYGELVMDWARTEVEEDEEISVELEADEVNVDEHDEDEDMIFIQLLESKKSNLLAEILMNRKDDDIPFEDYTGYESCFQETLDSPDEVFEKKDKEGDMIFTYIKAFSRGRETFYYIVTCLKRIMEAENVNVYPILALPTIDMEMCQEFRGGTRLSGPLKN
ncbi:hypothetical protein SHI21_17970 [Bacteriovorax sp. PP10]|uniref:Uncharacterized protein n=1 Tax=Bacteriovorax antarcticus TaxID=3088717 RepID=A0ABU5VYQ0_9BACT|nr:hypothetical protein [Bacteriovorax sp. PP10]MEA9358126.1 hypothetical protein [Bacteriovorax sp. PP10]